VRPGAINVIRFKPPDKKNPSPAPNVFAMAKALDRGPTRDEKVRVQCDARTPGAQPPERQCRISGRCHRALDGHRGVLEFPPSLAGAKKPVVSRRRRLAIGVGTTNPHHCDMTFATPPRNSALPHSVLPIWRCAGSGPPACWRLPPMATRRPFALLAARHSFHGRGCARAGPDLTSSQCR